MQFNYIAIEREYASGGTDIGQKLSELLSIPCYGKEIPEITAERNNISLERILELEENATGSLLYSLSRMASIMAGGNRDVNAFESVVLEEIKTIKTLAENGPAIFVGRTASKALSERPDVLRVFIHADMESREKRAMRAYKVCRSEVKDTIKKFDKKRAAFYRANFGTDWKKYSDYDLVLDSSILGIDKCAAVIAECAK